jgi:DNA-binding HxlR family transcriptional regulator
MTADTEAARVAAIAAKLTEAQRDVVSALTDAWAQTGGLTANWLYRQHPELCERMIVPRPNSRGQMKKTADYRLTPLGLRVRQHLQEQTDAHR